MLERFASAVLGGNTVTLPQISQNGAHVENMNEMLSPLNPLEAENNPITVIREGEETGEFKFDSLEKSLRDNSPSSLLFPEQPNRPGEDDEFMSLTLGMTPEAPVKNSSLKSSQSLESLKPTNSAISKESKLSREETNLRDAKRFDSRNEQRENQQKTASQQDSISRTNSRHKKVEGREKSSLPNETKQPQTFATHGSDSSDERKNQNRRVERIPTRRISERNQNTSDRNRENGGAEESPSNISPIFLNDSPLVNAGDKRKSKEAQKSAPLGREEKLGAITQQEKRIESIHLAKNDVRARHANTSIQGDTPSVKYVQDNTSNSSADNSKQIQISSNEKTESHIASELLSQIQRSPGTLRISQEKPQTSQSPTEPTLAENPKVIPTDPSTPLSPSGRIKKVILTTKKPEKPETKKTGRKARKKVDEDEELFEPSKGRRRRTKKKEANVDMVTESRRLTRGASKRYSKSYVESSEEEEQVENLIATKAPAKQPQKEFLITPSSQTEDKPVEQEKAEKKNEAEAQITPSHNPKESLTAISNSSSETRHQVGAKEKADELMSTFPVGHLPNSPADNQNQVKVVNQDHISRHSNNEMFATQQSKIQNISRERNLQPIEKTNIHQISPHKFSSPKQSPKKQKPKLSEESAGEVGHEGNRMMNPKLSAIELARITEIIERKEQLQRSPKGTSPNEIAKIFEKKTPDIWGGIDLEFDTLTNKTNGNFFDNINFSQPASPRDFSLSSNPFLIHNASIEMEQVIPNIAELVKNSSNEPKQLEESNEGLFDSPVPSEEESEQLEETPRKTPLFDNNQLEKGDSTRNISLKMRGSTESAIPIQNEEVRTENNQVNENQSTENEGKQSKGKKPKKAKKRRKGSEDSSSYVAENEEEEEFVEFIATKQPKKIRRSRGQKGIAKELAEEKVPKRGKKHPVKSNQKEKKPANKSSKNPAKKPVGNFPTKSPALPKKQNGRNSAPKKNVENEIEKCAEERKEKSEEGSRVKNKSKKSQVQETPVIELLSSEEDQKEIPRGAKRPAEESRPPNKRFKTPYGRKFEQSIFDTESYEYPLSNPIQLAFVGQEPLNYTENSVDFPVSPVQIPGFVPNFYGGFNPVYSFPPSPSTFFPAPYSYANYGVYPTGVAHQNLPFPNLFNMGSDKMHNTFVVPNEKSVREENTGDPAFREFKSWFDFFLQCGIKDDTALNCAKKMEKSRLKVEDWYLLSSEILHSRQFSRGLILRITTKIKKWKEML